MEIIGREEALALGLSQSAIRRRVKSAKWQELFPRVYLTSPTPASFKDRVIAACKWAGPGAVASGRTAGYFWKFPGCDQSLIEITTVRDARTNQEDVIVHRSTLSRREITMLGDLPITTPTRAVMDVAAVFDPGQLIAVVHDVLWRERVTLEQLGRAMGEAPPGRRGTAELERIVKERLHSSLERLLKVILDRARLRDYIPQLEVRTPDAVPIFIDFAYRNECVAVEADGLEFHTGRGAFQHDRWKWKELVKLGWMVLPFTHDEIKFDPPYVVATISEVLAARRQN